MSWGKVSPQGCPSAPLCPSAHTQGGHPALAVSRLRVCPPLAKPAEGFTQ